MHSSEIERLRKAIRRSYGSSPHKKKYWLALLENHAGALHAPNPFIAASPHEGGAPPATGGKPPAAERIKKPR